MVAVISLSEAVYLVIWNDSLLEWSFASHTAHFAVLAYLFAHLRTLYELMKQLRGVASSVVFLNDIAITEMTFLLINPQIHFLYSCRPVLSHFCCLYNYCWSHFRSDSSTISAPMKKQIESIRLISACTLPMLRNIFSRWSDNDVIHLSTIYVQYCHYHFVGIHCVMWTWKITRVLPCLLTTVLGTTKITQILMPSIK